MEKTTFIEKMTTLLRRAQTELEEFQVQLSLGKSEASDKYQDAKTKFKQLLEKNHLRPVDLKEKKVELQNILEDLQVQLSLGKAESIEEFRKQKVCILKSISHLESSLKSNNMMDETYAELLHEAEIFKIKLEMLQLHFYLGKADFKDAINKTGTEFSEHLQRMKHKFTANTTSILKESDHFKAELESAYFHLKNAFIHATKQK
jgi:hypothetical protein